MQDYPDFPYSVETLYHFSCPNCKKWWSVGDMAGDVRYLDCPFCKTTYKFRDIVKEKIDRLEELRESANQVAEQRRLEIEKLKLELMAADEQIKNLEARLPYGSAYDEKVIANQKAKINSLQKQLEAEKNKNRQLINVSANRLGEINDLMDKMDKLQLELRMLKSRPRSHFDHTYDSFVYAVRDNTNWPLPNDNIGPIPYCGQPLNYYKKA